MRRLTFWFDYASTYSYITAMHIEQRCAEADVDLIWQPILLGPIFKTHDWDSSPFNVYPVKGRYMRRDLSRLAEKHALPPFVLPDMFPQHTVLAARVGIIAQESGWVAAYSKGIFCRQFQQGLDVSDAAGVSVVLEETGQAAAEIVARASSDQSVKDVLRIATSQAAERGIFGAPTFTTPGGELFWGHERLDDAIAWLDREATG